MPEYQDCVFCSPANHAEGVKPHHETSECPRNPCHGCDCAALGLSTCLRRQAEVAAHKLTRSKS
jgi:hypothetical protein